MKARAAFTFVEVLAALTFLGILLPVVLRGLMIANRAGVISERTAVAAQLAENKLDGLIVDSSWAAAETRGDFGEAWPGYRWELVQGDWEADKMTELAVNVFFSVQGQEHAVRLTTLVSDSATTTQ